MLESFPRVFVIVAFVFRIVINFDVISGTIFLFFQKYFQHFVSKNGFRFCASPSSLSVVM